MLMSGWSSLEADQSGPKIDDVVASYCDPVGGGCTFLRIPGTLCDHRVWSKLDWPTHWATRDVSLYSCSDFKRTASAILTSHPGELIPVGFSMGGMIALEIARQAPERIAGLVLIGTNHLADNKERHAARMQNLDWVETAGLSITVSEQLVPSYFGPNPDPHDLRIVTQMALDAGAAVLGHQYAALASRRGQEDTLTQCKVPVLVIAGKDDAICDPNGQQDMAALTRLADFHALPGIGHMVPLEAPNEMMCLLQQWALARIGDISCQIAS
jgi:pimeloyl-ACP methyl ester carboxylesterase